jgi:NADH-quinone oxidoreductase subunit J
VIEIITFAVFAALALISGIVVVTHRNPVYSVMSLVVTLFSTAVLFVLLGAPFVAALLVLVYTGAILVLFLFVLMLLNVAAESSATGGGGPQRIVAICGGLVFAGLLALLAWEDPIARAVQPLTEEAVAIKPLARLLFSTYLLPFEIVGLLLLAAVVAATVLARKPTPESKEVES